MCKIIRNIHLSKCDCLFFLSEVVFIRLCFACKALENGSDSPFKTKHAYKHKEIRGSLSLMCTNLI